MIHAVVALPLLFAAAATPAPEPAWGDRIEWTDDGPAAREHASVMTFGDRVVVYAGSGYEPQGLPLGDAWEFDAATRAWKQLTLEGDTPTPAGSKRVAHDPQTGVAYLFGGFGEGFNCNNDLHRVALRGDTLVFTRVEQEAPPPPRALHAFAFDPRTRRFIATHGVSSRGFLGDTWVGKLDDHGRLAWRETTAGPSERFGFSFGFDTASGELVVLSGQIPPTPEAPMAMTDELWILDCRADDPAWRRADVADPPPGRRNPTFVYDDRADRLVAWCGTADGRTNIEDLVVVHRDNAGAWTLTRHLDEDCPPRRSSGFGFADPRTPRLFLGFGNSAQGRYRDWVVLDQPAQ